VLEAADTILDYKGVKKFDPLLFANSSGIMISGGSTSTERGIMNAVEQFTAIFLQVYCTCHSTGSGAGSKNALDGNILFRVYFTRNFRFRIEKRVLSFDALQNGIAVVVHQEIEVNN